MQSVDKMMRVYKELDSRFHHTEEELTEFSDMYRNASQAITDYFAELRKKDIPLEESYLTKWLDDGDYSQHFNNIYSFLQANFEGYFENN